MVLPKYSFLISVYKKDDPKFLEQSLLSMINQTHPPFEIILVIDGEIVDELRNVIDYYSKKHENLFIVRKISSNRGLAHALNFGANLVNTDYIARMDSDDISAEKRIEIQLKRMIENPLIALIGSNILEFEDKIDYTNGLLRKVPLTYKEIIKFSKTRSPFNHPTVIIKKSVFNITGGFKNINRKEDLEFFLRLLKLGYYCENIDEVLLFYRANKKNYFRRKSWANCSGYIKVMYNFYKVKYLTLFDFLKVVLSQILIFIMPVYFTVFIYNNFLRKKIK
jgi:glycosyltransferase involved in cell wall biosynthesis